MVFEIPSGHMERGSLWSLPNVLSLSRLFLAVAFAAVQVREMRLALILVAALTDFLDGWIARRSNTTSKWGELIDPITDRAFVFTALSVLLFERAISTLHYFVVLSRDLATAIAFVLARSTALLRPVAFRARAAGKVVTALQLVTLVVALTNPDLVPRLIPIVGIASLVAILDYAGTMWRQRAR
jgi:phosphatidylglycerophosphate synthase